MTERTALILDVDIGIDDSLALLYVAASPDAELVAVTCVSGNIDAAQVAINTRAVLELAGRTDVEVALGREVPLVRALETTPETHGPQGLGHAVLPPPSRPLSERHGVDVIVEEVRRRPGEIVLVTLGPLTNLALALEQGAGPAAAPEGLHADGRRLRRLGQHDADDRVEHPLRPGRREDRLPGLGRGRSRPTRPSRARSRSGST